MKEVIFTVEELAEYLKMNPMTIYRRAAAGRSRGSRSVDPGGSANRP